jgi:hypothetical protein
MLLIVSLECILYSCIEWEEWEAWMAWMEVVGDIYSLQPLPICWLTLLSMGTSDSPVVHRIRHCLLSGACHVSRPLGFGAIDRWSPLSSCGTEQSGGTPDSPMRSDFVVLTSNFCFVHCTVVSAVDHWRSWPLLCWRTRQSGGSPDSSVNYSGWAMRKPESGQVARAAAWGTGQYPVRHWLHQYLFLLQTL